MAVGVVTINIVGTSGGIVIPQVIGRVREATGGFTEAAYLVGAVLLLAALIVLAIRLMIFNKHSGHAN
jgi:hypothetical protein